MSTIFSRIRTSESGVTRVVSTGSAKTRAETKSVPPDAKTKGVNTKVSPEPAGRVNLRPKDSTKKDRHRPGYMAEYMRNRRAAGKA